MKKTFFAYLLIFSCCFMFFIYEPVMLYATNTNEFWFDLEIMIGPVLTIFAIIFLLGCLFFTLMYFVNRKLDKETKFYNIILLIVAIAFLASYIQGNFFAYSLPPLDGRVIDWNNYLDQNIYTMLIWIALITIVIIMVKKLKLYGTVKIMSYVSLAVCAMLTTSLVSILLTSDSISSEAPSYVTNDNINTISNKENFLVFLIDAVDEDIFYEVWQNNDEYKHLFDDFTYYRDAMSIYAYTRDSIPQILSGKVNKNETDFRTYSSNAYNNSILFQNLKDNNYKINLYEQDLVWNGKHSFTVENVATSDTAKIDLLNFLKQETKYSLFKYLPYGLKKLSHIETMNFGDCIEKYKEQNDVVYNILNDNHNLTKIDDKVFQFIHIEGGHTPYNFDKDFNRLPEGRGRYEQKLESGITVVKTYLERLKENGTYDNSVIIIMADHGIDNYDDEVLPRFNPLLMIKGFNEKHETYISNLPVSYDDLQEAYQDLLSHKMSSALLQKRKENKERTFIWYEYTKENHMVEYKTIGEAKDITKFELTGNLYDR